MKCYPSSRAVAAHEARHAASLCVSDLVPLWVRSDWPTGELRGAVGLDWDGWDISDLALRDLLVATIQGPLGDGEFIADWPVDPAAWQDTGSEQDGRQIAFLADVLELDVVDWHFVMFRAERQARDPRYRRLVTAIRVALEDRELLFRDELVALMKETAG